jgi:putative inorganic carbon (hco3(-)) transporter
MTGPVGTADTRRDRILLAAVATAPFVVYTLLSFAGYIRYLKLAAAGSVALAGGAMIFLFPRVGLWLLLFYVYLGSPFPVTAAPLALLALAAVILDLVRGEKNRLEDAVFWYANAFLLLIALGSILFAESPSLALEQLSLYGKILLIAYLIVQLVRTPEQLRRMMMVIFAGAVGTVFLGLANLALGIQPVNGSFVGGEGTTYMVRFSGAHPNPNMAAAVMCSAIPLGIFGLMHARPRMRILFLVGIVILIVAIFATFSRSIVFAFSFVSFCVLAREARSRRAYITLFTLLAIGILLAPGFYWERVLGLRDAFEDTTLDWSVYTRLLALQTAWEMFLTHPLTGVGIGNFFVTASYNLFVRMVVHNTYLEIAVGIGIFGLLAFLMVLLSGLRHSMAGARHRWSRHPAWLQSASFYWLLSGISMCMSAFFGSMPFRYFLWIPVAAGLVIGNLLREDGASRD